MRAVLIATAVLAVAFLATTVFAQTPPSPSTFVQNHCSDSQCTQNCRKISFPTDKCLKVTGGGSAMVTCSSTMLEETVWPTSTSCSGASQKNSMPLNQCLKDEQGTYFENLCGASSFWRPMQAKQNGAPALMRHALKKQF